MLDEDERKVLWWISLAAIGSVISYLLETISKGAHVKWTLAGIKACATMFLGYALTVLYRFQGFGDEEITLLSCLMGWIGADAVTPIAEKIFKRRFGIYDDNIFYPKYKGHGRRVSDDDVVIFKVDKSGIILEVSPSVTKLLGFRPDYYIGLHHNCTIPPEYRQTHWASFGVRAADDQLKSDDPFSRVIQIIASNNRKIRCRIEIKEDTQDGEKIFYAYLFPGPDITD